MAFPVVASLSAEELAELGHGHEKYSTEQSGTVLTGEDVASEDNSILSSWLQMLCIRTRYPCLAARKAVNRTSSAT